MSDIEVGPLPILPQRPAICRHLQQTNRLVLTAPTGSGKTTQVPQFLLDQFDGQVLVLQPRRLACRLVAERVAHERGGAVGAEVGYQTRYERRLGPATRLRFITEGLFIRLLQSDPKLSGVDAVVLDEFHERSLDADLALGLVKLLQEDRRPDLRLVVMSATLDAGAVATYLACPTVAVEGRAFPVEVDYLAPEGPAWDQAAQALRQLLAQGLKGDVLIFMPRAYEIRRTIERCQHALAGQPIPLYPLHASLPPAAQDQALAPAPNGKIIVSTNVAETSLTIPGIRHVIDSGLARVLRHDPRRGIDALRTEPISQAAAQQRTGRAGRTAPGTCLRLWSAAEHGNRPPHTDPEVARVDLAAPFLYLHCLPERSPQTFPWLQPPAHQSSQRAAELLHQLGALDQTGAPTSLGRHLSQFPLHPRLACLLVEASKRGCLQRALVWAALIGERDIFAQPSARPDRGDSDLLVREKAWEQARQGNFARGQGLDLAACRRIDQSVRQYRDICRRLQLNSKGRGSTQELHKCLLVAFFDRVALRLGGPSAPCLMAALRRVSLDPHSLVRRPGPLVALDIREVNERGGDGVKTVLSLASPIEMDWLEEIHPQRLDLVCTTQWDSAERAVVQHDELVYDGLSLSRTPVEKISPTEAEALLVAQIRQGNLSLDQWDEEVEQWLLRTRSVAAWYPERDLLTYDEDDVAVILHEIVAGATRYSHLRRRPCLPAVQNALSWDDRQFVERMAPTRLALPSGFGMKLSYFAAGPPRGRAKIQDLYGLKQTPRVGGGRQNLLLEILAPNFRPVQITEDLANFWRQTYPEVKKELKRRYPKHQWR